MIVDSYRTIQKDECREFWATVTWEDRTRDPVDVFMAVLNTDADLVTLNPDAFRIPAAVVALHDAEQRITGGGPVCPALRDGLANALGWLSRWSGKSTVPPVIDLPLGCDHPDAGLGGRSATFVSGGVDSTAVLAANHASYPAGHPRHISLGIVGIGVQKSRWMSLDGVVSQLEAAREHLAPIAAETEIEIIPVATNLRALNPSTWFWQKEYQGAVLAGIGHLFAESISNLSIASGLPISHLDRQGYHPLLDDNYATHSLSVRHELAHLGRYEKTALIASSFDLLDELHVCNASLDGDVNCGRCEKCVRTMLALEGLGLLATSSAFPTNELTPEDLRSVRIVERGVEGDYVELLEPLHAAGRNDLTRVIRRRIWIERFRRQSKAAKRQAGRLRDKLGAKIQGA